MTNTVGAVHMMALLRRTNDNEGSSDWFLGCGRNRPRGVGCRLGSDGQEWLPSGRAFSGLLFAVVRRLFSCSTKTLS